jgi:predicted RNase H-like nuclease (RuvC/YqgF family)
LAHADEGRDMVKSVSDCGRTDVSALKGRLRDIVRPWSASVVPKPPLVATCEEAADRIEQLEAEIERLRAMIHPFEGAVKKIEEYEQNIQRLWADNQSWCHESNQLRAEITRLRAALERANDPTWPKAAV